MSTRSLIAIPIEDGTKAIGRYHHFDGYPTGVGLALIEAYRAHKSSYIDLVDTLLFRHPAGWSNICGADWALDPGFLERNDPDRACGRCGEPMWRHYAQYYPDRGETPPPPEERYQTYQIWEHSYVPERSDADARPMCYCHGDRAETGFGTMICENGDTDGCTGSRCDPLFMEWEYRLYPQGIEVWEARGFEDTYRHVRRGKVDWDVSRPRLAMSQLEVGESNRWQQWGAQLETLATAVAQAKEATND